MNAATHDDNDSILIARLNAGDKEAFECIYRKYVRDLYTYARKNIGSKEDCEEIIQEIFESLWQRRADVRIQLSLRAYLLAMVRYKIVHHFRRSAVKKKFEEHFLLFEALYEENESGPISNAVIQSRLDRLMRELPERCQEALKLRLSENLSNKDIARRMNITIRTVETYMFRAFNYIRAMYKDQM